jgi:pyruvate dehydrogenase kinase 2/3/4
MTRFGPHPDSGQLIRATQFLRDELTIRLAHRVVELEALPHGLDQMPSVIRVRNWYWHYCI